MTSTIQLAVKEEHLVTLAEVKRGDRGLTCFKHGINHLQMYTDPLHRVNGHIPPPHGESPVGLTQSRVGYREPKGELQAAVT